MRKKENIDLTVGKVWKVMFQFSLPIFLAAFFQSLYTMVDAIIVGQYAGKGALAAIEAVLALTRLPLNLFIGLASGATIIISQYYGAKKLEKVSTASHNAMLFAVVGGVFLSVIGVFLASFAVNITKVPEEVAGGATSYLLIYFGGMVLLMIYNVGSGILRALGNSKTPFYFLVAANILNIVLDLVFIAVLDWGVVGAAVATVIASGLSAVLVVMMMFRTQLACRLRWEKIKFYPEHLREILKLGVPISLKSAFYPISNTIVQSSINKLGVDSIAAWAIAGKLDFLVWNISSSFAFAISTFVAQNYGAKQYHRAHRGVRTGIGMAVGLIGAVSVGLYFFSVPLAQKLLDDPHVIVINTQIIHFFVPLYFIYGISEGLGGAINGTGDTFRPMIMSLLGTCLFRILWIYFVVPLNPGDLITVLGSYPSSWLITALMLFVLYMKQWSKGKIMEKQLEWKQD